MKKAFKYELYPNEEQKELLAQYFGSARFVFNWALNRKKELYENEKKSISAAKLNVELTQFKKQEEYQWLDEMAVAPLQMAIRNCDSAFQNFFRRVKQGQTPGYPKFKSKHNSSQSFQFPTNVKVNFDTKQVTLPTFSKKVGTVRMGKGRQFEGDIKTCTISTNSTGRYYISVLVEDNLPEVTPTIIEPELTLGIDMGIKDFIIDSNGQKIENPKFLKNQEKRLAVVQRQLSKKQKGSKRRLKAKVKVAKIHERIRNHRSNFIHQLSSKIVSENQATTYALETLQIQNMQKNSRLAKSIGDAAWGEFVRCLEYKANWNGKNVIKIDTFEPSTKTCHVCGNVNHELTLKDRTWTCKECNTKHDRDINAAINIKKMGLQDEGFQWSPSINKASLSGSGC